MTIETERLYLRPFLESDAADAVCADRAVLAGYNDLATTDRKLLAEWDYEKNSLLPTQVSRKSMKSVWWKCSLGHSWKAKISDRTIIGEKCTVCENEYRSVFPAEQHRIRGHMLARQLPEVAERCMVTCTQDR